ncbi:hypothetical protein [Catellatospora sichuanensis]|uniref:GHMP family kinase ATP-binding protein n=1 Tax=Catellatospora sichuanensis TaxID=1969805 RepID=UPI00118235FD
MSSAGSAPLRIDLTGGYTDVPAIYQEVGGVALNLAVSYRTYVCLAESNVDNTSSDQRESIYRPSSESMIFAEKLLFHVSSILALQPPKRAAVRADGPKGCGLGSSASLAVAAVAAAAPDLSEPDTVQVARLAELRAGNECGFQDHVAAVYGGINALEFSRDEPFSRSRVSSTGDHSIEQIASLWHKDEPRSSGRLVDHLVLSLRNGNPNARSAITRLIHAYPAIKQAIQASNNGGLIAAVREVHSAQVALHDTIVSAKVQRLVNVIENRFGGAAKLQGGGGAGSALLVLVPDGKQPELERVMVHCGYRSLQFRVEAWGMLRHQADN